MPRQNDKTKWQDKMTRQMARQNDNEKCQYKMTRQNACIQNA